MQRLCLPLLALALLCLVGCSAYRAASKPFIGYSKFAPIIIVGNLSTNLSALASSPGAPRSDSVDATADIRAPVIICAEQLYLSFSGGSAASNSVLSQIEIPLVGAP